MPLLLLLLLAQGSAREVLSSKDPVPLKGSKSARQTYQGFLLPLDRLSNPKGLSATGKSTMYLWGQAWSCLKAH